MGRGIRGLAALLSQPGAGGHQLLPNFGACPWGQRRASGQRGQHGGHSCPRCPIQPPCQRWELSGLPGAGAAQAPGLPTPGLFVPGHAGGQGLARADTIKDGNLLIQALPALRCESGTVFFTTS